MGLFKSRDERRVERDMRLRQALRGIERSIRQQETFSEDFLKNARQARKVGDEQQYQFIRASLKRTAAVKKMLERQLLSMKNAMLVQKQAEAGREFAQGMNTIAREIGKTFGELDLTKTQADWEKAVRQAGSMEERMDLFLDAMEQSSGDQVPAARDDLVSDDEIDRMIEADVVAEEQAELSQLDKLDAEIARELGVRREKD
ncbi:MAG: hypothetical protein AAGI46_14840 [Planctomycetota bacterium]